jgi:ubiquinone/menaquinone biosynthesis C-methylase UbiE
MEEIINSVMTNPIDRRKQYWNENYYRYWMSRVDESNDKSIESKIISKDFVTNGINIYDQFFTKNSLNQGNVLDVGCGWGRIFPLLLDRGLDIFGIDISSFMISKSKKKWKTRNKVKLLIEGVAEDTHFQDSFFDNLLCLATFDATYQAEALSEFLRITKPGGMIYLSGKNYCYYDNDKAALAAEIGASNKGHPNFFTDVKKMITILNKERHEIIGEYYFPYRGDFAKLKYTTNIPEFFYEYFIVIRRGSSQSNIENISFNHSLTYEKPSY